MRHEFLTSARGARNPSQRWHFAANWRGAVLSLIASAAVLGALAFREWGEMAHQWWNIDTYNHILLVPLISIWLVSLKREALFAQVPRGWGPGLALVAASLALWLAGRMTGINLLAHAGAVAALQSAVLAIIGPRAALLLALPIAYAAFLVPFGDEIIPPLQAITAKIAIALTVWSGVPAVIDGLYIDTPAGLFIVAEECSGVKFLIAMVAFAVLLAFTRFATWKRRAVLFAAALIVPILANGVRAWGTIFIAQSAGMEFAAGFDHIFYGWIFFAIVLAIVLAWAWRRFECDPQSHSFSPSSLEHSALLARLEGAGEGQAIIVSGIIALALIAGSAAALLGVAVI